MTEPEWLACTRPDDMIHFLRGQTSGRKMRLFAAACCREAWGWFAALPDCDKGQEECADRLIRVAERHADGEATEQERAAAMETAGKWHRLEATSLVYHLLFGDKDVRDMFAEVVEGATFAAEWCAAGIGDAAREAGLDSAAGRRLACAVAHDVFGNPFRAVSIDPAWLGWNDGTVTKLARAIYEEQSFESLPILADALEEAGCTDADILTHCRQATEHVRGCWVVDLILGKS